jgi:hypothetical protein
MVYQHRMRQALLLVGLVLQGCGDTTAVVLLVDGGAAPPLDAAGDGSADEVLDAQAPDRPMDAALDDGPALDASADVDGAADTAPPPCGPPGVMCHPDQYCVLVEGGAQPCIDHGTDGGCPPGEEACTPNASGLLLCKPSKSALEKCRDLPPACTDPNPCHCLCPNTVCFIKARSVTCELP